jgi:precorrin-6A synthase
MRKLFIIGIGAGDPEQVTVQAIKALNAVDVFFVMDKGGEKDDLVRLRKEICERYIEDRSYRIVEARDPPRPRSETAYAAGIEDWYEARAAIYEQMIGEELGPDGRGGFLVWGDPAFYDSTIRIVERIAARGRVAFDYESIPGISSIQALAARHRTTLHGIGEPLLVTTGRRLAAGLPEGIDNAVVLLDADGAFKAIEDDGIDIYWGAYVGSADEILRAGRLREVKDEIERTRSDARARKGWIMDTYLLRRSGG